MTRTQEIRPDIDDGIDRTLSTLASAHGRRKARMARWDW